MRFNKYNKRPPRPQGEGDGGEGNMPKIKTHKATVKRFKKTRTGKIIKRKSGQGHFNSRESGKTTRQKRRDILMSKTQVKIIKALTPYS
ncbi:MAG: 50S ribosomal protein L35 [Candidatus Falkowbacteria bacterium]